MNYSKVLNDVIKAAEKRDSDNKDFQWKWGMYDSLVGLIPPGGTSIIIIPPAHQYLNLKMVFKNDRIYDLSKMFYSDDSAQVLTDTHMSAIINNHGCHIFKNGDEEIWIDERLLRPFEDRYTKRVYKGKSYKSIVEIWTEGDELLGAVLPINHKLHKKEDK